MNLEQEATPCCVDVPYSAVQQEALAYHHGYYTGVSERAHQHAHFCSFNPHQVVGALRKEHRLPLTYIALDWHEMDKVLGHEGIVEAFWSSVRCIEGDR